MLEDIRSFNKNILRRITMVSLAVFSVFNLVSCSTPDDCDCTVPIETPDRGGDVESKRGTRPIDALP